MSLTIQALGLLNTPARAQCPGDDICADYTSSASAVTPLTPWNFQAWFRDPDAGGSSFHLSNGIELLFLS